MEWKTKFEAYRKDFPKEAAEFEMLVSGALPDNWAADLPQWKPGDKAIATRSAGGAALNALAKHIPNIHGRIGRPESFHRHGVERLGRLPESRGVWSGNAGRGGRRVELRRA